MLVPSFDTMQPCLLRRKLRQVEQGVGECRRTKPDPDRSIQLTPRPVELALAVAAYRVDITTVQASYEKASDIGATFALGS